MPPAGGDLDRLETVILERLRDEFARRELAYRRRPVPLQGGRFSAVYAFEVTPAIPDWGTSFVIRCIDSRARAHLEVDLHDAANGAVRCAPRVALSVPDRDGGGARYIVMERLPGRPYLRGVEPWQFALDLPKLTGWWPRRLSEVLAALAGVDLDRAAVMLERHRGCDDPARPGRHLRAVASVLGDEPRLAATIDWLHARRPPPPKQLALVHGDLWPANVFIHGKDIRLIDWTRGCIDDPALDVGFAKVAFRLMPEPFPPPPPVRQLVQLIGRSIARRISAHCDALVGGTERVRYYEALRCAVELADVVVERRAHGRSGWDHGVPAIVRHLERITKQSIEFR